AGVAVFAGHLRGRSGETMDVGRGAGDDVVGRRRADADLSRRGERLFYTLYMEDHMQMWYNVRREKNGKGRCDYAASERVEWISKGCFDFDGGYGAGVHRALSHPHLPPGLFLPGWPVAAHPGGREYGVPGEGVWRNGPLHRVPGPDRG